MNSNPPQKRDQVEFDIETIKNNDSRRKWWHIFDFFARFHMDQGDIGQSEFPDQWRFHTIHLAHNQYYRRQHSTEKKIAMTGGFKSLS